MTKGER